MSSFHFIVGYQFFNCYYFISGLGALQERSGDLRERGWNLNNPIIPMHPPYSSLLDFLVSEHIATGVKSNKREVRYGDEPAPLFKVKRLTFFYQPFPPSNEQKISSHQHLQMIFFTTIHCQWHGTDLGNIFNRQVRFW